MHSLNFKSKNNESNSTSSQVSPQKHPCLLKHAKKYPVSDGSISPIYPATPKRINTVLLVSSCTWSRHLRLVSADGFHKIDIWRGNWFPWRKRDYLKMLFKMKLCRMARRMIWLQCWGDNNRRSKKWIYWECFEMGIVTSCILRCRLTLHSHIFKVACPTCFNSQAMGNKDQIWWNSRRKSNQLEIQYNHLHHPSIPPVQSTKHDRRVCWISWKEVLPRRFRKRNLQILLLWTFPRAHNQDPWHPLHLPNPNINKISCQCSKVLNSHPPLHPSKI